MQPGALHKHLDKQNLGDRVERDARFHLVHVAQDVVAVAQQLGELAAIERALPGLDRGHALGIAPVSCLGDLADSDEFAGQCGDYPKNLGEAPVMGDEKFGSCGSGIAFALIIVTQINADAFRFAFDNQLG